MARKRASLVGDQTTGDPRDIDDPSRLVEEAAAQRVKMAEELRAAALPIESEPATIYRP